VGAFGSAVGVSRAVVATRGQRKQRFRGLEVAAPRDNLCTSADGIRLHLMVRTQFQNINDFRNLVALTAWTMEWNSATVRSACEVTNSNCESSNWAALV
jgi:hypothetical protein